MFKKRGFITGATIATAISVAAGAMAAIPSSDGGITGCVAQDGNMKVIDEYATCPQATTLVRIGRRGPTGATGMRGMQGPAGTANVHWARVDSEGRMTAKSSENVYTGWFDTGGYYFGVSSLDLSKCSISITPDRRHPDTAPASAEIYETYSSYTMFYMKRLKPSAWPLAHERVNVAFYVSASCT